MFPPNSRFVVVDRSDVGGLSSDITANLAENREIVHEEGLIVITLAEIPPLEPIVDFAFGGKDLKTQQGDASVSATRHGSAIFGFGAIYNGKTRGSVHKSGKSSDGPQRSNGGKVQRGSIFYDQQLPNRRQSSVYFPNANNISNSAGQSNSNDMQEGAPATYTKSRPRSFQVIFMYGQM
jgi:hypothetical protein